MQNNIHGSHARFPSPLVERAQAFVQHERREYGLGRPTHFEHHPTLRAVLMHPDQHDPAVRRALALGTAAVQEAQAAAAVERDQAVNAAVAAERHRAALECVLTAREPRIPTKAHTFSCLHPAAHQTLSLVFYSVPCVSRASSPSLPQAPGRARAVRIRTRGGALGGAARKGEGDA
jgi:hypothetical protein